jgi:hypothetical protein
VKAILQAAKLSRGLKEARDTFCRHQKRKLSSERDSSNGEQNYRDCDWGPIGLSVGNFQWRRTTVRVNTLTHIDSKSSCLFRDGAVFSSVLHPP